MIYHFDFYRVKSLAEIIDLGFEEYVSGDGICLIEWPEKAREILPLQRFSITLGFGKDESARKIDIRENIEVEA
jgi:tRNA threonylcarbamoyladenosine biosynthesis protein TsaE